MNSTELMSESSFDGDLPLGNTPQQKQSSNKKTKFLGLRKEKVRRASSFDLGSEIDLGGPPAPPSMQIKSKSASNLEASAGASITTEEEDSDCNFQVWPLTQFYFVSFL